MLASVPRLGDLAVAAVGRCSCRIIYVHRTMQRPLIKTQQNTKKKKKTIKTRLVEPRAVVMIRTRQGRAQDCLRLSVLVGYITAADIQYYGLTWSTSPADLPTSHVYYKVVM